MHESNPLIYYWNREPGLWMFLLLWHHNWSTLSEFIEHQWTKELLLHRLTKLSSISHQAMGYGWEKRQINSNRTLLGARMLLGAPGLTTRNKKLLEAPGIATRSKDATRNKIANVLRRSWVDVLWIQRGSHFNLRWRRLMIAYVSFNNCSKSSHTKLTNLCRNFITTQITQVLGNVVM